MVKKKKQTLAKTRFRKTRVGQKLSVGAEMIRDLEELNRVIDSGESVFDHFTCSRVVLKLEPREYTPEMVKEVRKSLRMSQGIFAQFIGVSAGTVKAWEQGQNPVPMIACRFLDEMSKHPDYWRARLNESAVQKELVAS